MTATGRRHFRRCDCQSEKAGSLFQSRRHAVALAPEGERHPPLTGPVIQGPAIHQVGLSGDPDRINVTFAREHRQREALGQTGAWCHNIRRKARSIWSYGDDQDNFTPS